MELDPGERLTPPISPGSACVHIGRRDEGLRLFQRAVELDPRHGSRGSRWAGRHLDLGRQAEALLVPRKSRRARGRVGDGPDRRSRGLSRRVPAPLRRSRASAARLPPRVLEAVERSDNMYRDTFRGVCLVRARPDRARAGRRDAAHAAFTQAVAHLRGRPRALGGGHLARPGARRALASGRRTGALDEALVLFRAARATAST